VGGKGDVSGRERRKKYLIINACSGFRSHDEEERERRKRQTERQNDGSVIDHGPWIFYSLFDAFIRVFSVVCS
jgi:hypothetical protein